MPDDTAFVQRIAAAEQNGNFQEAFKESIDFIYGNPGLLRSGDAAGWKDRARQLSADLANQNLIPPFNIIDGNGIEVNPEIPTTQSADGARHVNYSSGLSLEVVEFQHLKISEPTGGLSGTFTWNAAEQLYVEDRDPPRNPPLTAELIRNPNDSDQPTLVIHDQGQRAEISFNDDGDKTTSYLGSDGQSLRSVIEKANGLRIDIEGSPEDPDRKMLTYPDGTTISVIATNEKVSGKHVGWTTTINAANRHDDGGMIYLTTQYDLTAGQMPPPIISFSDESGTNYSIDNHTLSLSVTPAVGAGARYYMSGIQPEIDQDSYPVVQPTPTLSGPMATPVSAFGN